MMRRTHAIGLSVLAALSLLVSTGTLVAFQQHGVDKPLADKEYRHPDLHISNVYVAPADLPTARTAGSLAVLGVDPAAARIDTRTGRWGTLILKEPMLPGNGNSLTWQSLAGGQPEGYAAYQHAAWDAFTGYLSANRQALGVDPAELRNPGNVTVLRNGTYVQINAPREIGGIPVRDSYLTAVINSGNLILFGAVNWGDVGVSPIAAIDVSAARDRLAQHLGVRPSSRDNAELQYVPMSRAKFSNVDYANGLAYRLAWVLHPRFDDGHATEWLAMVDAHTGELISFEDKTNYAGTTRRLIGDVFPTTNTGVPPGGTLQSYPIPYANITAGANSFVTDPGGNVPACVEGTISTDLTGPYIAITDNCGVVNESTAGPVLDLEGVAGTNCTIPAGHSAGDTNSARTAFYELGKLQEMGRSHLPNNVWLQGQLPVELNINLTCNATGGPGGLRFYIAGGGCSNTGELAGVFDHEWGHGMDGADANPGISTPGEGIADIYGSLRLNDSCIGENFFPGSPCGGYGDPCLTCTGVRDIDYANRNSGIPHTLTWIDNNCNPAFSNGPCGGSVHCEGAVYAEAVWDLWNRHLTAAPYSMSVDTAREVAARLTFQGGTLVGAWYSCVNGSGGDGCNADGGYLNYLAADDDNGDLSDGTPHMGAIFTAFDNHEIACPTPTNQDSGCAGTPATAPTLTATPSDRGVSLSWTAVGGASSYRLFRTEGEFGCDFGKTLIYDGTDLSFVDSGLANGRQYSYVVAAMGPGDTCYGPTSSCSQATPTAGANMTILPQSQLSIFTGDGDVFVDNCEEARVVFNLDNIGTGNLTNVEIVGVSSPSHPAIDASIAFNSTISASLAECDTGAGAFDFRATGLSFNDTLEFEVEVSADGLASNKTATFSIPMTESDFSAPATVTFDYEAGMDDWTVTSGTFNRSGAGGGNGTTFSLRSSNAVNNACDRAVSPALSLAANSTLTLWNNFDIEPQSGGTWYDRANLAILENGERTVLDPDGGRLYNASGTASYSGCNGANGWAATQNTWGTSSWSAGAFGGVAPTGTPVQLEMTYGTDGALAQGGFWFDEVEVTNAGLQVPDTQSNVCGPSALIFADGFESGNTSLWSSTNP